VYSISDYGNMIADSVRTEAYARALRTAVKPGSVVIDIGTGTGFFALLACKYGARRVYAIEPTDAIAVAQEMATANGYSNQIDFIQDTSTSVTLPERGDVIVSDIRGGLPLFGNHLPAIVDARNRLLKSDGLLIPSQDRLWVAVTESPKLYDRISSPWLSNGYGLNMRAGWRMASNNIRIGKVSTENLLVSPTCWACLDYMLIEKTDVVADLEWPASRAGIAHGIAVWFDSTLAGDIDFSNAPGLPDLTYGISFFPFSEPVPVKRNDLIFVKLYANLVGDNYIWRWNTRVTDSDRPEDVKASFDQSTLWGVPLSSASLRKQASVYQPLLNHDGECEKFILTQMDGKTTVEEIANRLVKRFPSKLANSCDALSLVSELSKRYGD
jgi:type I protein arginine methyltransferase